MWRLLWLCMPGCSRVCLIVCNKEMMEFPDKNHTRHFVHELSFCDNTCPLITDFIAMLLPWLKPLGAKKNYCLLFRGPICQMMQSSIYISHTATVLTVQQPMNPQFKALWSTLTIIPALITYNSLDYNPFGLDQPYPRQNRKLHSLFLRSQTRHYRWWTTDWWSMVSQLGERGGSYWTGLACHSLVFCCLIL